MNRDRRDFLKGTAWMLGAAAAVGCTMDKVGMDTSIIKTAKSVAIGDIDFTKMGFDIPQAKAADGQLEV